MTDEKFTKLSEEDLDLVVGGAVFHDVFITPSATKPGKYDIVHRKFEGDPETYKAFMAGKPVNDLNVKISKNSFQGCSAADVAKMTKKYKDRGYTIHQ